MSADIFVRRAEKKDKPLLIKWLISTARNLIDPAIFQYPLITILAAFKQKGPIAFLPLQQVTMLESLAINPDARRIETAAAIAQLIKTAVFMSRSSGVREVYF